MWGDSGCLCELVDGGTLCGGGYVGARKVVFFSNSYDSHCCVVHMRVR